MKEPMQYKPKTRPRPRNEEELVEVIQPTPFQVMLAPLATSYKVNVDQSFESVKQFENIVHILDHAQPGDIMEIKLSTDGGALHAILPLLSAIANTPATVYVHAVSDVASAGTFLLMIADDVFVNPYATIMFHQVKFGAGGQGNHVEDHVAHVMRTSKGLIRDMYQGFFSEEEIEAMLGGKEYWMDKAEFDRRYDMREALRQAALAAEAPVPKKRRSKKTTEPQV